MRALVLVTVAAALMSAGRSARAEGAPLRVCVIGLVHGHVGGFLSQAFKRQDVVLVGISEPDAAVADRYVRQFGIDRALIHSSTEEMLDTCKPEAALVYSNTFDHARAVELCASHRVHVMMEKPLAVSITHARAISAAAARAHIHVLVNYETTWYPNNQIVRDAVIEQKRLGTIRKIVVRDGHQGPKEIGVQPEFLAWLTDPTLNGAGALFDFGCYGANLSTWLMAGERPVSVYALTQRFKPAIYPLVDDDATVVLEYPHAQAVLQASWSWPYGRKDWEIYGDHGYLLTVLRDAAKVRVGNAAEELVTAKPWPKPHGDPISYLAAVVRGTIKPGGLSSLENNMIVTEILDAARRSARTGKVVRLPAGSR